MFSNFFLPDQLQGLLQNQHFVVKICHVSPPRSPILRHIIHMTIYCNNETYSTVKALFNKLCGYIQINTLHQCITLCYCIQMAAPQLFGIPLPKVVAVLLPLGIAAFFLALLTSAMLSSNGSNFVNARV